MSAESNRIMRTTTIRWYVWSIVLATLLAPVFAFTLVHAGAVAGLQARRIDVAGSVLDQHGDAIAGAKVLLGLGQTLVGGVTTDDRGRFHFNGLGDGGYTLTISADGFASQEQALAVGSGAASPRVSVVLTPKIKDEVVLIREAGGVRSTRRRATVTRGHKENTSKPCPANPSQLAH